MLGKLLKSLFGPAAGHTGSKGIPETSKVAEWMRAGADHAAQGRFEAAERAYREVLQFVPGHVDALYSLGIVHARKHEYGAAKCCLEQVIADQPHHVEATNALGNVAKLDLQWEAAARYYRRALELQPDFVPALSNLGLCLKNEGRPAEGIAYLERAFRLQPGSTAMVLNYALGLLELGRAEEGEAHLRQALQLDPKMAEARIALALLNLARGRYAEAWPDYEWRMRSETWEPQLRVDCPVWTGASLDGRTLLVRAEQGLGDQIMFASCLPEIVSRSGLCVVECDIRLKPIFARSFPGTRIYASRREGSPGWLEDGIRPDLQVQIGSLPHRLQRDRDNFPRHRGYLRGDPEKKRAWHKRLDGLGRGLKIGISWRGGTRETRTEARSIPLQFLVPLFSRPAHWVSLQYGDCGNEIEAFSREHGIPLHHWCEAIDDYDQTAALVDALDLVIAVQTAVVHLAGALGRPAWAMIPSIPEWRYLDHGEKMPWYPSARLFRQPRSGDWMDVVSNMAAALENFECRTTV
ncbi:MAG: tetratricopeptide repeat protein [Burkholderiales bacterium]|nr:tetratricopeptide repeat protein [Burkholderiales bacterium]